MGKDPHESPSTKSKRGTVNNSGRLSALLGARNGAARKADWGGCDPRWIAAVIIAVTNAGGAVTFSVSRDGGAHGLTIMLDGERASLWFNGDADLDAELEQVFHTFETT